MNYSYGIYGYFDTKYNKFVYIGQDSHIDENERHKAHHQPSRYNKQRINSILQNNPGRYEYIVLEDGIESKDELNEREMFYIEKYGTFEDWFNYTKGGDGSLGHIPWNKGKQLSEEHKQKISETLTGRTLSEEHKQKIGEAHRGVPCSEEHKQKLREANLGENNPMYGVEPWNKGIPCSEETKKKISETKSKYALWDPAKCTYHKSVMFGGKRDGSSPCRCFRTRYNSKDVPIGMNMDFTTCEIINDLISDACKN